MPALNVITVPLAPASPIIAGREHTMNEKNFSTATAAKDAPLRNDIRRLGDLLGETLKRLGGKKLFETEEHVRSILINLGLQEIINHPLTTPENHEKLQLAAPTIQNGGAYTLLANPSTPERRALRRSLLVSALENTVRNLRYTNRLATFEVGRAYFPEQGDGLLPREERRVSLVLSGPRRPSVGIYPEPNGDAELDFFDLKGVVETLLNRLGFNASQIEYRAKPETGTFGPRCAEVMLDGQSLGLLGEIHPQVRAAYNLPAVRINAAELNIEPLVKPHWRLQPMPPISNYPPVVEDLAFEVAEEVIVEIGNGFVMDDFIMRNAL